jgi:hypothetical protein
MHEIPITFSVFLTYELANNRLANLTIYAMHQKSISIVHVYEICNDGDLQFDINAIQNPLLLSMHNIFNFDTILEHF